MPLHGPLPTPPSACHATVTHRENPTLTLTLTLALNTNPNPSPSPNPSPDQVKYLEITNALKTVDGGEGGARDGQASERYLVFIAGNALLVEVGDGGRVAIRNNRVGVEVPLSTVPLTPPLPLPLTLPLAPTRWLPST